MAHQKQLGVNILLHSSRAQNQEGVNHYLAVAQGMVVQHGKNGV